MRLSVLSSGSSGNATYVESERGDGPGESGGLLVDAGLSARRISALLAHRGRTLADVRAVLLTHDHSDHTSGVRSLVRECGVRVFAPSGVWRRHGATVVEAGEPFEAAGMEAVFFDVPHDSRTCGVRLSGDGYVAALATDLGEVTPSVLEMLMGAEAVVLEANHDVDWLRNGPYHADLKRRIFSAGGHLSNRQAAQAALALAAHGLKDVVLAHLSKTNNSPARACGSVSQTLREAGYGRLRVRAALARHPTPWIEVGAPLSGEQNLYLYRRAAGEERLFEVE